MSERLAELLDDLSDQQVFTSLGGYPVHIASSLAQREVRSELGARLVEALRSVSFEAGAVGDLWRPPHVVHDVPVAGENAHPGIPTGLAFSGMLLNCYLYDFDHRIDAWLRLRQPGQRAAVLRFADDIIVLGQTSTTIAETLDALWVALEGSEHARLASPLRGPESVNLRVNWDKVEPEKVRSVLGSYLKDFGWTEDADKYVEPAETGPEVLTFAEWLRRREKPTWLDEFQIARDRIGPFVTHLVERMSTLGGESLDDRFGRGAKNRLDELHQLLRLDIDDPHVRNDSRLAFAANKIVRAFLPNEGSPTDPAEVAAIRNSIAEAVLRVPWKFSLWRSVVHGACRRPLIRERTEEQLAEEDNEAGEWLIRILHRIADNREDSESWMQRWPEKSAPELAVRELYLSFLRAQFWLAVGASTRDLRRIARREDGPARPRHWSSLAWTFRAVDEKRAPRVRAWLGQLDRWVAALYGERTRITHWWEKDALASAALSQVEAVTVPATRELSVPDDALPDQPRVMAMLKASERVAPTATDGSIERWAHAALAVRPHRRAQLVELAKEVQSTAGPRGLRWAAGLGLLNFVERDAAARIQKLHRSVKRAPTLPKLEEYQRARRIDLAFLRSPSTERRWSIHRLLWTVQPEEGEPLLWPAAAPALGLPPRVALRMLVEGLSAELGDRPPKAAVPVWNLPESDLLWRARTRQLASGEWAPLAEPSRFVTVGTHWEVRPHGAYFLPGAVNGGGIDPMTSRVWSHVLQFLTAAQGDESFLDQVLAAWPQPTPLEERWSLRADVPIAVKTWRSIDAAIKAALANDVERVRDATGEIVESAISGADVVRDFSWDRVDIALSLDGGELPVGCVPFRMEPPRPVGELALPEKLPEKIDVTLAQISVQPDWVAYRNGFFAGAPPAIPRQTRQEIMAQFAAAFASRATPTAREDGPILFPEVALPLEEERPFRAQVLARRRAALAGLHWGVVPFAMHGNAHAAPPPPTRYLVNEALLVVPVCHPRDPSVQHPRVFRIRKPLPTHLEHSLAATLSEPGSLALGSKWQMLPGNRWYRFVHPVWGDFTVAICSDIIDPAPWASMQGQILHLFLISFNSDIQLYESLTWLRAYEAYANVVATNHGRHGGSFAWTPLSGDAKELARLRGERLFLVADIRIEVAELAARQTTGVLDAVERGKAEWTGAERSKNRWKAPPPGYRRR